MANISELINWEKTLKTRHAELVRLRDSNSATNIRRYGNDDKVETKPEYDTKKLDKRVTLLSREIRLCNDAIKRTNAETQVSGYEIRDEVLGELED